MKINVFGLGYVGCVSAVCLANSGNHVTGIDVDSVKVDMINQGHSPIVEPGLEEALQQAVSSRRLLAAFGAEEPADVSMICVGTPSNENGSLQLRYVKRVTEQIAEYLQGSDSYHVVNVRSTILPGTIHRELIPILESGSRKKVGRDFGICMNPEFMREGTSLQDYLHPPFTVIGEYDAASGDRIAELYSAVQAPLVRTSIPVAETLKYSCNVFHAVKVTFANEIGNLCKKLGIDSHELMDIFCLDTKLNLSPYYLKPGFAFGGSCLPKDLRAILYLSKTLDLETPLLNSILPSNRRQLEVAFRMVERTGKKKVGLLGLSFKPGSDDLRESPMIELVERLIGKGYEISVFDREVSLAKLFGSNRSYIETVIPHISSLMTESLEEILRDNEVVLVAKKNQQVQDAISGLDGQKIVIDLVRIRETLHHKDANYEGICW